MIRCQAWEEHRYMCGEEAVTIINRIPFCKRHAELVKQNRPVEVRPYKKEKKHDRTIKD